MVRYNHKRILAKGAGGNWGSLGLPSQTILEVTPSRMSENALLQNRIYITFFIDLYGQKEKLDP